MHFGTGGQGALLSFGDFRCTLFLHYDGVADNHCAATIERLQVNWRALVFDFISCLRQVLNKVNAGSHLRLYLLVREFSLFESQFGELRNGLCDFFVLLCGELIPSRARSQNDQLQQQWPENARNALSCLFPLLSRCDEAA